MPIPTFFNSPLHSTFRACACCKLTLIWNEVVIAIFRPSRHHVPIVGRAVVIAIGFALVGNVVAIDVIAGAIGSVALVGDAVGVAVS